MNEEKLAIYSTLNIVFGIDNYWFINEKNEWEESDGNDISFFQSADSKKVAKSLFWKNLASKIYQYDNDKYSGIASIQYEEQLSKYKINFNPITFYEFLIYCMALSHDIKLQPIDKIPFNSQLDVIIQNELLLENYGWNHKFYTALEKDGWNNIECWKFWNNLLHRNKFVFDTVINIFIHEMMHLIWNHVERMIKSEDRGAWNIAADFAINQNLAFPMPVKEQLVTQFSKWFYPHAQYCFINYLHKKELVSIPKSVMKLLDNKKYFIEKMDEKQINEIIDFNYNKEINNKNADFYYDIFKEFSNGDMPSNGGMSNKFKHNAKSNSSNKESDKLDENGQILGNGVGEFKVGNEEFDTIIKQIEIDKIFQESYEGSEEFIKGSARSEIPFSYALKDKIGELKKKIRNPIWKKELRNFIISYLIEKEKDITMTRSNRKRPDIFPGLKRDVGLDLVFIIDTSGSIMVKDYKLFKNEISTISKECELDKCRIIQCHTQITSDVKGYSLNRIGKIEFKERGGTRMRTALELLKRTKNKKPVIIFTDGDIDYFTKEEFNFKILLFITKKRNKVKIEKRGFKVICPKETDNE